jgi:uncharacterized membrane-anchored protein
MNQSRIFRIMELVWLSVAVVAGLSSAWLISKGQIDSARYPLFVTFCGGVLFALRRYQRKRMEKVSQHEQSESTKNKS